MPVSTFPLGLTMQTIAFAAAKHRNQRRKDAEASPYINHPIDVANILVNEGGIDDVTVLHAALLHDTVEDTETSPDELRELVGDDATSIVLEVTDDKSLDKKTRKRLQVEHASHLSEGAKLVKLADKISNLRDVLAFPPPGWSREEKLAYFDWGAEVVDRLRGINPKLESAFDAVYRRREEAL